MKVFWDALALSSFNNRNCSWLPLSDHYILQVIHIHQEVTQGPMKTHMWTFLTTIPSIFVTITAFPSPSLSISFRLNKTFPCHGILKVVYMCMSNAMNMDVTSFFGAWPPACPLAGTHPPSRHKTPLLNEHSVHRRHSFTPAENTHALTHTPRNDTHNHRHTCMHIYTYMHTHIHRSTHPTLSCSRFFSSASLHWPFTMYFT